MSFTLKDIAAEAAEEVADELRTDAKKRIKEKLRQIRAAERVVANLKGEYEALLADIGAA
jgi:hypothetical protein